SDLVKLLEHRREAALDGAVSEVMTRGPSTIAATAPMSDAVALLARRKISELPVIDDEGRPIGLVDITDLAGIWPEMEGSLAEEDDVETPRTLPFYPRVAGPGA